MKIQDYRLGFIGFGHMAQILCRAIEAAHLMPRSHIFFHQRSADKAKANEQKLGITATSFDHLVDSCDILMFCVRPHQAESILHQLSDVSRPQKFFCSVMAGIQISFMQKYLGASSQVVRVMPNIASSVKEGMSLLSFAPDSSSEMRSTMRLLFGSVGKIMEIPEAQMDIGCGIAGSGPGFVVELIEAMAKKGKEAGLSYEHALLMASQTFLGAATLVQKGHMPQELLEHIATPNGTTIAGLTALRKQYGPQALQAAVEAAAHRSEELSKEFN